MREDTDAQHPAGVGRPPIDDYDHMTLRGVESRLGTLGEDDLEDLVRYECAHQDRTQVIRLLTARLQRLRETRRSPGPRPGRSGAASGSGGYGPAPAASYPGRSLPDASAACAPETGRLPPPRDPRARRPAR
ncbi:hypothetical protein [Actinacidiphila rubida]|uniref:hypothetical protein n=1 Tax=Actinacidiphila rubida TaxID=310780 RepID=UPI000849BDCA|nr:hypothetical protein [Actinacidiphila rubida]